MLVRRTQAVVVVALAVAIGSASSEAAPVGRAVASVRRQPRVTERNATSFASYVALGDSYTSGEGLGPYEAGTAQKTGPSRNLCHRSAGDAYPDLSPAIVLPSVSSRAFWACSGATVADMESASTGQFGQPAQIAEVGAATKYISVTVGGDDLNFGAIGRACADLDRNHRSWKRFAGTSCSAQLQTATAAMGKLQTNLVGLYEGLLSAASGAKLVVAGYPRIFPASYTNVPMFSLCATWKGTTCSKQGSKQSFCVLDHYPVPFETLDIGLPVPDASAVDSFEQKLNATIQHAVAMVAGQPQFSGRIGYADTYTPAVTRNCKGTTPNATVTGFEISPHGRGNGGGASAFVSSATFHPTQAGQRVLATAVQKEFQALTPAPPPSTTTPTPTPALGSTIASAPAITPGIQESGNTSDGQLPYGDCPQPDYADFWTIQLQAGQTVTFDFSTTTNSLDAIDILPPGTTDANAANAQPLYTYFSPGGTGPQETTFTAQTSGSYPLDFNSGCYNRYTPGPYTFVATLSATSSATTARTHTPRIGSTSIAGRVRRF